MAFSSDRTGRFDEEIFQHSAGSFSLIYSFAARSSLLFISALQSQMLYVVACLSHPPYQNYNYRLRQQSSYSLLPSEVGTTTIASGISQVIACSPQRLELQLRGGGDNKVIWLLGPVTSRGKVSGSDNTSRANKKVSKNEPMHALKNSLKNRPLHS